MSYFEQSKREDILRIKRLTSFLNQSAKEEQIPTKDILKKLSYYSYRGQEDFVLQTLEYKEKNTLILNDLYKQVVYTIDCRGTALFHRSLPSEAEHCFQLKRQLLKKVKATE